MANFHLTTRNIKDPQLLLDKDRVLDNIQKMAGRMQKAGVIFRPHFKTHQSVEVGRWFQAVGVEAITVSSLKMAYYFARDGWTDITVAFPANLRQIDLIEDLADKLTLHLLVDNKNVVHALGKTLTTTLNLWIKIDVGTGRAGIHHQDLDRIKEVADAISAYDRLHLKGILAHPGHTYDVIGKDAVVAIHHETVLRMKAIQKRFAGLEERMQISLGDTPCASLAADFSGIDEMRPGNFVFYDLMQERIGACKTSEIAICMACPVVAVYPEREEILIHGGAVHFGKEFLKKGDHLTFGTMVMAGDQSWVADSPRGDLVRLSQEHGIIRLNEDKLYTAKVGDLVHVLPVHSCLTADYMGGYLDLDGNHIDHFQSGKGVS